MIRQTHSTRRTIALALALSGAAFLAACRSGGGSGSAANVKLPAVGSIDADKYLYQRGVESLNKKHWYDAQEYFRRLVETYPQSDRRQDAKIGRGDAYLGLNSTPAGILAIAEFREFLQYYPLNPRADYALYQICRAESRMMLSSQRDQSATIETLKDINTFLQRYPTDEVSKYRPQVVKLGREAQDRLSGQEFIVGLYYYKLGRGALGGAINRFEYLLAHDPEYTKRDEVFYYLAESMLRLSKTNAPKALPLYKAIVDSFPKSKFYKEAQVRMAEIMR